MGGFKVMAQTLTCFKAYDVRGRVGDELNEEIAFRLGFAYGQYLKPGQVAVGGDARHSSFPLKNALSEGLRATGCHVLDLGLTGTEEIYYAVFSQNLGGGIQVTGSHNPISDNGFKLVKAGARPLSELDFSAVKALAQSTPFAPSTLKGGYEQTSFRGEYLNHLLSYININNLRPLRVLVNGGNGAVGPVFEAFAEKLVKLKAPLQFIKMGCLPDGDFPNGVPNPLLPENRGQTVAAMKQHQADVGIAWDGDFDRCFFFAENGEFVEGYYLVGLLAESFLAKHPRGKIVHDPRLTWNTIDVVRHCGGEARLSKTGHAYMKECMRAEQAVYGGE
ncbi:MAG: phosphomannomutase CpsG, partial [Candidatus Adiutrix sp.]